MVIHLKTGPRLAVDEPDDLGRLQVEVAGLDQRQANAALSAAGLGRLADSGIAWLAIHPLREAAQRNVALLGPGWSDRWDAMVSFAREHGWVDDSNTHLRAHVLGLHQA